ncbi:MAG TPA: hypothetical protein VKS60_04730, partial [Stellaceae bacterium]|nr:hypothetical protein [Stellaceae bacterium]
GVNAAIELAAAGPAGPVSFTDPAVGDTLVAVPLPEVGMAVAQNFDYPDLRVFDSAQGLAFHPLSDGVAVHIVRGKVEITAPDGLMLAANQDRAPSPISGMVLHATSWQGKP